MGAGGGLDGQVKGKDGEFGGRLSVDFCLPIGVIAHLKHDHAICAVLGNFDGG